MQYDAVVIGAPCGHCSWCLNNHTPIAFPQRAAPSINEYILRQAGEVRQVYPEILSDPYVLTRFLCGVASPKLTRSKLSSHALFGSLGHIPFQAVLSRARSGYDSGRV